MGGGHTTNWHTSSSLSLAPSGRQRHAAGLGPAWVCSFRDLSPCPAPGPPRPSRQPRGLSGTGRLAPAAPGKQAPLRSPRGHLPLSPSSSPLLPGGGEGSEGSGGEQRQVGSMSDGSGPAGPPGPTSPGAQAELGSEQTSVLLLPKQVKGAPRQPTNCSQSHRSFHTTKGCQCAEENARKDLPY